MADRPATSPHEEEAAASHREAQRLVALERTGIMDTEAEQVFDDLVQLASLICGTPIALVSLVDAERQWFKARVGLDARQTPRDQAFCAHAIQRTEPLLEVPDAQSDPRFAANPLVTGEPRIRFYAGAPIVTAEGHALGTVCVIDRKPRALSPDQREALVVLARQAARQLEWRRSSQAQARALHDEMAQNRERLEHAMAAATLGLALQAYIDSSHVYRFVNDLYLEYWRHRREDIEGQRVVDLLGPALYEQRVRPLLDRAFAGETVRYEATFDFPGPGRRYMRVEYIPVRGDDGAVAGVVVRSEDLNDIEQARVALAEANEQLRKRALVQQRFVHMVSHDIREPVNSICNFAGLLEDEHAAGLGAEGRRSLGFVRQGGERLRVLLDDLQRYVQLEDDGAAARSEPVDLQAVMGQVLADLSDATGRHGARLLGHALPVVAGDPTLLRIVLQNLVSNALKYHAPGTAPVVDWGADRVAGGWAIWVSDQGIGIAQQDIGKLFNTFARLVKRRQYEGTGLGLATCRRIAEMHGGTMSVESNAGQGSRFTLHLPDRHAPARATEAAS